MIILDTHTLIWWVTQAEKLSQKAKNTIEDAKLKQEILVSSISIWEISFLIQKKRIDLSMSLENWVKRIESLPFIRFIPIDNQIILSSISLPEFPNKDPADRIIIATAIQEQGSLVTVDSIIQKYKHVKTIW